MLCALMGKHCENKSVTIERLIKRETYLYLYDVNGPTLTIDVRLVNMSNGTLFMFYTHYVMFNIRGSNVG